MNQNTMEIERTEPVIILLDDDDGKEEEDEKKVVANKVYSQKVAAGRKSPGLAYYLILTKLPVKSISRFRCVCAQWKKIFKHPKFIKDHLTTSNFERKFKLLIKPYGQEFFASLDYHRDLSVSSTFSYKPLEVHNPLEKSEVHTFSSVNGVVFVEGLLEKDNLCLWNPSTKEFKMVLKPKVAPDSSVFVYVFGYCPSNDDYKIARARKCYRECGDTKVCFGCEVLVYSLRADSWKEHAQGGIPYDIHVYDSIDKDVHVHGKTFWKATRCNVDGSTASYGVIIVFHIGDDTFREVAVVPEIDVFIRQGVKHRNLLAILDSRLCILNHSPGGVTEIWSMREYGVKESWTKWHSFGRRSISRSLQHGDKKYFMKPVWDFRNGEVLFIENYSLLVLFDIARNKRIRVLKIRGISEMWLRAVPYIESLVPLNSGKYVQGRDGLVKCGKNIKKEPVDEELASLLKSLMASLMNDNEKRVKVENT